MNTKSVLLVDGHQPSFAKRTDCWKRRECLHDLCTAGGDTFKGAERAAPETAPVRLTTLIPNGCNQSLKLPKCCSASNSVGAMNAARHPARPSPTQRRRYDGLPRTYIALQ
ncbi:MAG: hypothetical protein CM1200mP36_07380 [Gammaproteobacteria bacterium]|nr:MAG: hypothetical protein CM1200mP36_07380 [Gammaproteobacteria bacterium]